MSTNKNIVIVAGNKAFSNGVYDKARKALAVGEFELDATVRLLGSIKKGEPYEQTVSSREGVDPWTLLRIAMSKLNDATVESIVREALAFQNEAFDSAIKDSAAAAVEKLVPLTQKKVMASGKTTGKVVFEIL